MNHPRLLARVLVGLTGIVLTSSAWVTAADAIRSVCSPSGAGGCAVLKFLRLTE